MRKLIFGLILVLSISSSSFITNGTSDINSVKPFGHGGNKSAITTLGHGGN